MLLILPIFLSSCYTVLEKKKGIDNSQSYYQSIFPKKSKIDSRLLGEWEKTFTIMDSGLGTESIYFYRNGTLSYRVYRKTFLDDSFYGVFRNLSDTLIILNKHSNELEEYLVRFENEQIHLQNINSSYSTGHHSIHNFPSRGGFKFVGK